MDPTPTTEANDVFGCNCRIFLRASKQFFLKIRLNLKTFFILLVFQYLINIKLRAVLHILKF